MGDKNENDGRALNNKLMVDDATETETEKHTLMFSMYVQNTLLSPETQAISMYYKQKLPYSSFCLFFRIRIINFLIFLLCRWSKINLLFLFPLFCVLFSFTYRSTILLSKKWLVMTYMFDTNVREVHLLMNSHLAFWIIWKRR